MSESNETVIQNYMRITIATYFFKVHTCVHNVFSPCVIFTYLYRLRFDSERSESRSGIAEFQYVTDWIIILYIQRLKNWAVKLKSKWAACFDDTCTSKLTSWTTKLISWTTVKGVTFYNIVTFQKPPYTVLCKDFQLCLQSHSLSSTAQLTTYDSTSFQIMSKYWSTIATHSFLRPPGRLLQSDSKYALASSYKNYHHTSLVHSNKTNILHPPLLIVSPQKSWLPQLPTYRYRTLSHRLLVEEQEPERKKNMKLCNDTERHKKGG